MRLRFLLSSLFVALLTGCGVGNLDTSVTPTDSRFAGTVHGGETPISYSNVSFYETAATGVATNGVYVPATPLTALGSTFTDINGNFSFATPLHCQNPNDFVYAVAAGGNTGSTYTGLNPFVLEMAAVGSCASFGGSTFVVINEVSTVAAAYALSGFTSVSGGYGSGFTNLAGTVTSSTADSATFSTGSTVYSGQPVYWYGCTPSVNQSGYALVQSAGPGTFTLQTTAAIPVNTGCNFFEVAADHVPVVSVVSSATNFAASGVGTATAAAGLNHAFANAAMLATLGAANTTVAGNPNTVLPTTMVNSIADVLQACVNSTGGQASSSTVNDGTACGKLDSYTTDVSGTSEVVPRYTLQAALNLARFPAQNVPQLVSLFPPNPAFLPVVTTTPSDLSLAVQYGAGFGAGSDATKPGLAYPADAMLDANDTLYVQNSVFDSNNKMGTNLMAISSAGSNLWTTPLVMGGGGGLTADSAGNVFAVSVPSYTMFGSPNGVLNEYLATSGALEAQITAASAYSWTRPGVGANGDVFLPPHDGGTVALQVYPRSGAATGPGTYSSTPAMTVNGYESLTRPIVASNGTVFSLAYDNVNGGNTLVGVPYTGTGANLYTSGQVVAVPGDPTHSVTSVAMDAAGTLWVSEGGVLTPYAPIYNSGVLTGFTAGMNVTLDNAMFPQIMQLTVDGAGTFWGADGNVPNIAVLNAKAVHPTAVVLNPCVMNTQGPCSSLLQSPQTALVDAAGSVWVTDVSSVFQVIGSAAPTFPLAASQKPGVMP